MGNEPDIPRERVNSKVLVHFGKYWPRKSNETKAENGEDASDAGQHDGLLYSCGTFVHSYAEQYIERHFLVTSWSLAALKATEIAILFERQHIS